MRLFLIFIVIFANQLIQKNMIVTFTVGNFRSFKDKMTLDFRASSISELSENVATLKDKTKLLRTMAVYGANSSGKSNLIKAMKQMKDMIGNSVKLNASDNLDYNPFLFSTETEGQPTFFELDFYMDADRYRYGFEYNKTHIVTEWLFKTVKKKEEWLFLRENGEITVNEETFAEGLHKAEATNENRLFLSLVSQLKGEVCAKIMEWFRMGFSIISGIEEVDYQEESEKLIHKVDKELNEHFFQPLKLGFSKLYIEESAFDVSKKFPELISINKLINKKELQKIWEDEKVMEVYTVHNKYDSNGKAISEVSLDCREQESDGTNKVISLSYPIWAALLKGRTLIIDEIDTKLHPIITQELIKYFTSPHFMNRNPQLFFSTHDTNLLSSDLLRRDQVWFTEKDEVEQTDLYRLADIHLPDGSKIRKDANLEKNYIQGRYGAIPYISHHSNQE